MHDFDAADFGAENVPRADGLACCAASPGNSTISFRFVQHPNAKCNVADVESITLPTNQPTKPTVF